SGSVCGLMVTVCLTQPTRNCAADFPNVAARPGFIADAPGTLCVNTSRARCRERSNSSLSRMAVMTFAFEVTDRHPAFATHQVRHASKVFTVTVQPDRRAPSR